MIFAIEAAPAAIPVKPNTAAMSAMMRNVMVHRSIKFQILIDAYEFTNCMPPCDKMPFVFQKQ